MPASRHARPSAGGWAQRKRARRCWSAFDMVLAQDEEIAARFRALGARNVEVVGSLKADAPPLACDEAALAALQASRSATGPCCWRPRPIPAKTKPCCRPMTCCARAFPICSPSSCRAIPSAAPISRCCAAAAPARRRSAGGTITSQTADLYRRHHGRAGAVLSPGAFLFPGRHPGAAGRPQSAGAGGAALRRAGRAASPPARRRAYDAIWRRRASAASPAAPTSRARRRGCWPIPPWPPRRRAMRRRAARPPCPARWTRTVAALEQLARCARLISGNSAARPRALLAPLGALYGASVALKARIARPFDAGAAGDLCRQSDRRRQRQDARRHRHRRTPARARATSLSSSPAAMAAANAARRWRHARHSAAHDGRRSPAAGARRAHHRGARPRRRRAAGRGERRRRHRDG